MPSRKPQALMRLVTSKTTEADSAGLWPMLAARVQRHFCKAQRAACVLYTKPGGCAASCNGRYLRLLYGDGLVTRGTKKMPKPNYQFEKRQRELEKKKKKQEKAERKANAGQNPEPENTEEPAADDPPPATEA